MSIETVKSGSMVFSVPQRGVGAAEELKCVQIHAIKLAVKPQQKSYREIVTIRHLLVRCTFKEKCIFMDNGYIKEVLFLFISLSSHLKLSVDIFIMSVRHEFAVCRFIFVKRSCLR